MLGLPLARPALARPALAALLAAVAFGCSRSPLGPGDAPGACAVTSSIASGDEEAWLAAVDDLNVYWVNGAGPGAAPTLRAAPRCGGAPATLTDAVAWSTVAVDGQRVYFVDSEGTIASLPRGGGTRTELAPRAQPTQLVSHGARLYWLAAGFFSVPLGGAGPQPTPHAPPDPARYGRATAFTIGEEALYWLASPTADAPGGLFRVPIEGGAVQPIENGGTNPDRPFGALALDGEHVYYTRLNGDIASARTGAGPAVATTTLARFEQPGALAVTHRWVYWSAGGDAAEGPLLRRVAKDGATPATTVLAVAAARSLLADGDGLWVSDGQRLLRIAD